MSSPHKTRKTICLVTGSGGYIGQQLINQLISNENFKVVGLDIKGHNKAEGWQSFEGNLLDPALSKLLNEIQPDLVFHAAAAPKNAPLADQLQSTVLGTEHLIKCLAEAHINARVVVLGSAAEYGTQEKPVDESAHPKPEGVYGIAKLAQTQAALLAGKQHNIPVMVGRIFNVYGYTPATLAIASLTAQITRLEQRGLMSPRVKVFNLLARRDFIHINDVTRALMAIAEQGHAGEIYNIASGEAVQLQVIAEKLLELSELKNPELKANGEQVDELSEAKIAKLMNHTGWKPSVPLNNGLEREIKYWREAAAVLTV